jgi:hypothetical protein
LAGNREFFLNKPNSVAGKTGSPLIAAKMCMPHDSADQAGRRRRTFNCAAVKFQAGSIERDRANVFIDSKQLI